MPSSLGYGSYIFNVDNSCEELDDEAVLGLFTWQDDQHEIDIELSRWGNYWSDSTQYVVQPGKIKGNILRFTPNKTNISIIHAFTWK